MAAVERTAQWNIHGYTVSIFEIETNYIARIYQAGKCMNVRVFKKGFLHPLRMVYRKLDKELATSH